MMLVTGALVLSLAGAVSGDRPIDPALQAVVERSAPASLKSYRLPERQDLTGDWEHKPDAWRARADFNGDGVEDVALLLVRRQGTGFQLLMLLSPTRDTRVIVLEETPWAAQGFGLAIASAGRYITAVGKGYNVKAPDDPDEIVLQLPALDRFHFESWNAFWYWDSRLQGFKYMQMSD